MSDLSALLDAQAGPDPAARLHWAAAALLPILDLYVSLAGTAPAGSARMLRDTAQALRSAAETLDLAAGFDPGEG